MTFSEKSPALPSYLFLILLFFIPLLGPAQAPAWQTVVDSSGKKVLQIVAERLKELTPGILAYRYGGKWGLVTRKQVYLTANVYDTVESLQGKQMIIGHHGAYFLLNERGQQTEPGTISKYFTIKSGFFYRTAGEWFFQPYEKNELTRFGYFQAKQINDSLVELKDGAQVNWWVSGKGLFLQRAQPGGMLCVGKVATVRDKNLTYLMENSGKYILPTAYQDIQIKNDTVFEVSWENSRKLVDVRGNTILQLDSSRLVAGTLDLFYVFIKNKIGLADGSGCLLVRPEYDSLKVFPKDQICLGIVDNRLQLVEFKSLKSPQTLPIGYWKADFNEGYAPIKKGNYFGFIDKLGMFRIAPRYDSVCSFSNGIAKVKMAGKWGVINKRDAIVIQPIYENIEMAYNMVLVKKEGMMGCFDSKGKQTIPIEFDSLYLLNEKQIAVKKQLKWGLTDLRGDQLLGLKYEGIKSVVGNFAIVQRENKFGISRLKGGLVSDAFFENLFFLYLTGSFVGTKSYP